jgi:hypothetical protein
MENTILSVRHLAAVVETIERFWITVAERRCSFPE